MAPPYCDDLDFALELASGADEITLSRFLTADLAVETKPDLTPVTEADQATERYIRDEITARRPGDLVAGEEYGGMEPGTIAMGRVWIIDPIDGTKNYVRGVPIWATLIALVDNGQPVVGAVSAPAIGRRWWGQLDGGAFGSTASAPGQIRRLQTSNVTNLADASFSYSDNVDWDTHPNPAALAQLIDSTWRSRAYGDFYSHILVAEGAVDIAAEPVLNAWDVAALVPIIREAGGRISGYDGSDILTSGSGLTTNSHLHDTVLAILNPT